MSTHPIHPTSGYTRAEELANTVTHGIGAVLSVAGLVVAVVLASMRGDPYLVTACAIYGTTLILLHLSSTLYHAARSLKWKKAFLAADHSSIYLLIAGTYTPFCLGPLRGAARPRRGTWLSTAIYLGMGWLVLAFLYPLVKALTASALVLLISGGLLYSIGVLFYRWHSLKFHHAIWHGFVMAGALTQFLAVLTLL